ncbi:tyrosine phosphatase: receptor type: K-like protein [Leptotrombidium deliense]|uniref:protein-tyrosine-phosphatase n=1 Tax=Leptotrombidium deliense TaxID=299467 RepID=A0A443SG92_9ACAR|nr:tyrosine phosphatase: receptor type: K-like protein [Leptotrombidium deliense]
MNSYIYICLFLAIIFYANAFENKTIGEFCEKRFQKPTLLRKAGLEDYLKTNSENGILEKEFNSIPSEQLFAADQSEKPENKPKNRYQNILAYDHSRVALNRSKSDSDYINANFLDAVDAPDRYIVTQTPMENTVKDFWEMVWENNIYQIVTISKIKQFGKERLFKYWPEDASRYGKVEVTLDQSDYLSDYVIRKFTISYDDKHRVVTQYHFITWDDNQLPNPETFLAFVNEVRASREYIRQNPRRPLLVHCSTGSGPSATFVLINSATEALKKVFKVDFSRELCSMRMKRMQVVDSYSQFVFAIRVVVTSTKKMKTN